jgi:hypothetical protein
MVTGPERVVPSESRSYGNPTSINWNAELSTITLIGDVGGAVRLTTFGPGATVKNVAVETTSGGTTMVTPSGVVTVPPSGETSSDVEPPGKSARSGETASITSSFGTNSMPGGSSASTRPSTKVDLIAAFGFSHPMVPGTWPHYGRRAGPR